MGRNAVTPEVETYQEERIEMFCRSGSHDKVYNVQLVQCDGGWSCLAQGGRRGSTLNNYDKCHNVDYLHAKKAFNAVVVEKTSKNPPYRITSTPQGAPTVVVGGIVSREVEFSPELLTRISLSAEVMVFAKRDRFWFQKKRDDRRLVGVVRGGKVWGYNKTGWRIEIDAAVGEAMLKICKAGRFTELIFDGEIEQSGFWVWDLLELKHIEGAEKEFIPELREVREVKALPYRRRHGLLAAILEAAPASITKVIHLVDSSETAEGKIAFLERMRKENAEGIVIKDANAPYRPGRNGQHFKFKFEQTASVIVGKKEKADDHRSVGIYVVNGGGKLRYVGSVGVPDKYDLPAEGAVIEVRYLYAHGSDGKLAQAKYFGKVRDDVQPQECLAQQLRVKQEAA